MLEKTKPSHITFITGNEKIVLFVGPRTACGILGKYFATHDINASLEANWQELLTTID